MWAEREAPHSPTGTDSLETWITTVLEIAGEHGSGLPVRELTALLPPDRVMDERALLGWLLAHPQSAAVEGAWVFEAGGGMPPQPERRERASRYEASARELVAGPLRATLPWLRCVGVTGSTAYGAPAVTDDIDFLIVARRERLWLAMLRIYLSLRRSRLGSDRTRSVRFCFNYARDDPAVRREFSQTRDFLFAREALSARILYGEEYYRALLGSAPWMRDLIPVLYARCLGTTSALPPEEPPPPLWVRAANAVAYLVLATYFQTVGLWRNDRLRRRHRAEAAFRTQTTRGAFSFDSVKFEKIRSRYPAPIPPISPRVAIGRDPAAGGSHPIGPARGRSPQARSASGSASDGGRSPSIAREPARRVAGDAGRD